MRIDDNLQKVRVHKDVKAHREFILRMLDENEENFRSTLEEAREFNPSLFIKSYIELSKMVMPKQQDVNVNLTLNKDFQELQALASSGQTQRSIEDIASTIQPEFIEYEELNPSLPSTSRPISDGIK